MRRNQDVITGPHRDRLFAVLEEELGFALQNDHPFGLILIVPEAFRRWFRCPGNGTGEQFHWHQDLPFEREDGQRSFRTLMIYLNEGFEGGATSSRSNWKASASCGTRSPGNVKRDGTISGL
jgi:hypothetical protein